MLEAAERQVRDQVTAVSDKPRTTCRYNGGIEGAGVPRPESSPLLQGQSTDVTVDHLQSEW